MAQIKGKIDGRMPLKGLPEMLQNEGFESIEDFIKANFHYLSSAKQALFHNIINMEKEISKIDKNGKN